MSKLVSFCFVLFVCCAVNKAAITESQRSKIHTMLLTSGLECIKDHPLSFEHIQAFRDKKVPEDEEAKCFMKCFFMNFGITDESGKLSEEKTKESTRTIFKEGDEMLSKVDELLSKCIKVNDEETNDGDKGCDRAKLVFLCLVKQAPKLGLDVDF